MIRIHQRTISLFPIILLVRDILVTFSESADSLKLYGLNDTENIHVLDLFLSQVLIKSRPKSTGFD